MIKNPNWLIDYSHNVFSQDGEDGIIAAILEKIPVNELTHWCVEFGAWDGIYCSNTRNLIQEKNYKAVLIEGSLERFNDLRKTYAANSGVEPICSFVGFSQADNLDTILQKTSIPLEYDVLSVDIDGNDYHVWKAAAKYRPKVVCIEFNPTVPNEVEFVQLAAFSVSHGCSILSLYKLGIEKGYSLVAASPRNAFFVLDKYYPLFEIQNNTPAAIRTELPFVTHFFYGYDGKVFISGNRILAWHNTPIKESRMQQLPAIFRKFPFSYNWLTKKLFTVYKRLFK
jgi:hypothetical protein